jgi:HAD superfamily hydrolase (TIGR01457 family)
MEKERIIDAFDAFIFDMDGVLYLADQPIETAAEFIGLLSEEGRQVLFLTNNSKYGLEYYRRKLKGMGINARGGSILSSSTVMREYLQEKHKAEKKTAFVIGGRALEKEVARVPLEIVTGEEGKRADCVVVGWDTRITYEKLKIACLAIFNGAAFVATNDDATFPAPEGKWPGAGAMVGALQACTGIRPVVVGKPNRFMMDAAMRRLKAGRGRTLMIGDRLETDVLGGSRAGMKTCLVLTGVSGREDARKARIRPDYIVDNLLELA